MHEPTIPDATTLARRPTHETSSVWQLTDSGVLHRDIVITSGRASASGADLVNVRPPLHSYTRKEHIVQIKIANIGTVVSELLTVKLRRKVTHLIKPDYGPFFGFSKS